MQHLSPEDLARLVDEAATPEESLHLEVCGECRAEADALRDQTLGLRELPGLRAPPGLWSGVEDRLRAEGLVAGAPAPRRIRLTPLLRIAAGLALFVAGAGTGSLLLPVRSAGGGAGTGLAREPASAQEAAEELRAAEGAYVAALARYAELTGSEGGDPVSRLAALEGIVLTARAALQEAPSDPVINGYLLTALGQREAILRQISGPADEAWF